MLTPLRFLLTGRPKTTMKSHPGLRFSLMTVCVEIAKFVHNLYDSNIDPNSTTWYHGHFIGGVNPFNKQTNNCLIIAGYYHIPVSEIHTPLGYWSISGGGCGDHKIINDHIQKNLGLVMLCPGYQTEWGYYGPYWLVTEFNGKKVPHPEKELLPFHIDLNINNNPEDKQILDKYLKQMECFYKKQSDYIEYDKSMKIFDRYLANWLKSGLIRDKYGLSVQIINHPESHQQSLEAFKNLISPKSHDYVFSGNSLNNTLFKAIYESKLNVNIE